jgi:hypothetical protein
MVDQAKLRWRIERDYHELKQEAGLGHYEGRDWCGFHHHATLCVAVYGFLISEKAAILPQDIPAPGAARNLPFPKVTDPEDLPLRSRRHMPNSTAMLRIRLARTLAHALPRCPCCGQGVRSRSNRMNDAVGLRIRCGISAPSDASVARHDGEVCGVSGTGSVASRQITISAARAGFSPSTLLRHRDGRGRPPRLRSRPRRCRHAGILPPAPPVPPRHCADRCGR